MASQTHMSKSGWRTTASESSSKRHDASRKPSIQTSMRRSSSTWRQNNWLWRACRSSSWIVISSSRTNWSGGSRWGREAARRSRNTGRRCSRSHSKRSSDGTCSRTRRRVSRFLLHVRSYCLHSFLFSIPLSFGVIIWSVIQSPRCIGSLFRIAMPPMFVWHVRM